MIISWYKSTEKLFPIPRNTLHDVVYIVTVLPIVQRVKCLFETQLMPWGCLVAVPGADCKHVRLQPQLPDYDFHGNINCFFDATEKFDHPGLFCFFPEIQTAWVTHTSWGSLSVAQITPSREPDLVASGCQRGAGAIFFLSLSSWSPTHEDT